MDTSSMDSGEAIETVRAICDVSSARASELLEAAGGTVERAVEIHLSQQDTKLVQEQGEKYSHPTPVNKSRGTLDSFVGTTSSATSQTPAKKARRNTTLDAFLSPQKKRPETETQALFPNSPSFESAERTAASTAAKTDSPKQPLGTTNDGRGKLQSATAANASDSLPYAVLAASLAEMTATTKRTVKTSVLIKLFTQVIQSVGGIHDKSNREQDALALTRTMDLILGKLSSSSSLPLTLEANATVLQVSGSAVSTAIQTVTGVSRQELGNAYRKSGDLGDVAALLFVSTRQKQFFTVAKSQAPLSISQVHEQLRKIANVSAGKGSQKERLGLLVKLLRRADDKEELRFLVRLLLGNMRLGATIKTVIVALATAVEHVRRDMCGSKGFEAVSDPAKCLEKVFNICPRLDKINAALLIGGVPYAVKHCSVEIGFPIQPMLADPVQSFGDIQSFLTAHNGSPLRAVAEYKYDGMRCQAHWDGRAVKLFSRNMLENTQQYPDAIDYILESKSDQVTSFILDAEIVGVAPDEKCRSGFRLLPFQDLSTRRGTKMTADDTSRISIRVYAFDLMAINGRSLIDVSLGERQALLRQYFRASSGFAFAESQEFLGYREAELQSLLQRSIDEGAEGLMLKLVDSDSYSQSAIYESGTRSKTWKKVKKDYLGGFSDTIDVVPIGAWYGNGRKAGKGFLSPVLFAVYDDDEGVFRSISRCMSFSDAMYLAMREFYFRGTPYPSGVGLETVPETETGLEEANKSEGQVEYGENDSDEEVKETAAVSPSSLPDEKVNCFPCRPPSTIVITNESPPIWFTPLEVFEVSFADLSLSKAHTAAAGLIEDEQGRGVALRFPRFKRRRPDKLPQQATTCSDIARLFGQQSKMKGNNNI